MCTIIIIIINGRFILLVPFKANLMTLFPMVEMIKVPSTAIVP